MSDQLFIILLVLEVILTLALIGLVLMQPSDGALGGLGGGSNPLAQNQSSTGKRSDPFQRATVWTAVGFFIVSILLAFYSGALGRGSGSTAAPDVQEDAAPVTVAPEDL